MDEKAFDKVITSKLQESAEEVSKLPPIYYFRVDPETSEITRKAITKYTEHTHHHYGHGNSLRYFKWRDKSQMKYCYDNEFDIYKNNHIYSFDGSMENAVKLVLESLRVKAEKARKDHERYLERIEEIQKAHASKKK